MYLLKIGLLTSACVVSDVKDRVLFPSPACMSSSSSDIDGVVSDLEPSKDTEQSKYLCAFAGTVGL